MRAAADLNQRLVISLIAFLLFASTAQAADVVIQYHIWYKIDSSCPSADPAGEWWHWVWIQDGHDGCNFRSGSSWLRNVDTIHYPLIGIYSSSNAEVQRWHMRLAKAAGVTAFLVSTFPSGTQGNFPLMSNFLTMLQVAHEEGFKIGLEAWQPTDGNANWYNSLKSNIDSIQASQYADAIYKINNKMVVWFNYWADFDTPANLLSNLINVKQGYYIFSGEHDINSVMIAGFRDNITNGSEVAEDKWYNQATDTGWQLFADLSTRLNAEGAAGFLKVGHLAPYIARTSSNPSWYGLNDDYAVMNDFFAEMDSASAQLAIVESWNDFYEMTAMEPGLDLNQWDDVGQERIFKGDPYRSLRAISTYKGVTFAAPSIPCAIVDSVMITAGMTNCGQRDQNTPRTPSSSRASSTSRTQATARNQVGS